MLNFVCVFVEEESELDECIRESVCDTDEMLLSDDVGILFEKDATIGEIPVV